MRRTLLISAALACGTSVAMAQDALPLGVVNLAGATPTLTSLASGTFKAGDVLSYVFLHPDEGTLIVTQHTLEATWAEETTTGEMFVLDALPSDKLSGLIGFAFPSTGALIEMRDGVFTTDIDGDGKAERLDLCFEWDMATLSARPTGDAAAAPLWEMKTGLPYDVETWCTLAPAK